MPEMPMAHIKRGGQRQIVKSYYYFVKGGKMVIKATLKLRAGRIIVGGGGRRRDIAAPKTQSAHILILAQERRSGDRRSKTHLGSPHVLVRKVPPHPLDELHLLLDRQPRDRHLHHAPQLHLVHRHKRVVVHVCEEAHDELAVHPVRHSAVAGDRITEILDLKRALQARGEEAAEGRDERRKGRKGEGVELHGGGGEGEDRVLAEEEEVREGIGLGYEDGVGDALEAGEEVGAEVLFSSASTPNVR